MWMAKQMVPGTVGMDEDIQRRLFLEEKSCVLLHEKPSSAGEENCKVRRAVRGVRMWF